MEKLEVFENNVLSEIRECKKEIVTGYWRQSRNEELRDLYLSPNVILVTAWRRMRCADVRGFCDNPRHG
jgi:hypothetical protein